MLTSLLFRRLFLPAIVVVVIAVVLVAALSTAVVSRNLSLSALIWSAIGIGAAACLAIAVVVLAYARTQGRAISDTFSRTMGRIDNASASSLTIDDTIDALAGSLHDRLTQASRDKAQLQTILS